MKKSVKVCVMDAGPQPISPHHNNNDYIDKYCY